MKMRLTGLLFALLLPFVGAGAQAKRDTTSRSPSNRVHTVTGEQMNKGLVNSTLEALSGQVAGVTIAEGSQAAMLSAVRVRGTTSLTGGNDPLVIIDGVIADLSTLDAMYPGDIERFEILKDASETALYGSRGASGVIRVVTVKSSDKGFHIRYEGTGGVKSVYRNMKMLSADGFRAWNDAHGYSYLDGGFNSDMPSSILRTGYVQKHHLSFGGGSGGSLYNVSLAVMDDQAVIRTQGTQNYTAKVDVQQEAFNGILHFDLGMFGSIQWNGELHDMQHLFYSSSAFNPTIRPGKEPDGTYVQIPEASQINHPVSLLEKKYDTNTAHFNLHMSAHARPVSSVTISAFGSYTYDMNADSRFFPTIVWSHGEAYRSSEKVQDLLGNLSVNWKQQWQGGHRLELMGMTEIQRSLREGFFTTTTGFTTNIFGYDAIQAGTDRPWSGTASYVSDVRNFSGMINAVYAWKDRYILNASLRTDASSLFGPNHRWGLFPSVSASWVASQEEFLRNVSWLSELKISAGYGQSGNQAALGPYNSLELLAPAGVVSYDGDVGTIFSLVRNENPDLRWEVRSSANASLEASFLDERIVFNAEYYWSETRDMLYEYQVSVPPFHYDRLMANLGRMRNSGLELGFGAAPLRTREMQLTLNMNLAFQWNRLVSLSGWWQGEYLSAPDIQAINAMNGAGFHGGDNDIVYQIVGQPLGVFYLPHCTGLVQAEDGTFHYETDGVNHICGQVTPKARLGANLGFRWRDWDLTLHMNGAFGHKIYNGTSLTYMNTGSLPYYNVLAEAPARNIADQTVTDYWLEKGDYLNFAYLTIGWNIPVRRVVRNLRISASVNNLGTVTAYSGLTPLLNSSVVGSNFGLDDKVSYPVFRTYSLSIGIHF